jgi:predicted urease superfamily metal-dependent hydrolase
MYTRFVDDMRRLEASIGYWSIPDRLRVEVQENLASVWISGGLKALV